jgi:hypothetical protein
MTASRATASQATSSRIAGRHHLGISGRLRRNLQRLLRLLPDPTRAHEPGSLDPPKITLVSLAAVAEWTQSLQRTAPSWRAKVLCSGRCRFTDGVLAHVRTPGGPTSPAQSLFRLTRSSPTPRIRQASLTQSNRRGTDPYAGGGGGVASRGVPYPDQSAVAYNPARRRLLRGANSLALFPVNCRRCPHWLRVGPAVRWSPPGRDHGVQGGRGEPAGRVASRPRLAETL